VTNSLITDKLHTLCIGEWYFYSIFVTHTSCRQH